MILPMRNTKPLILCAILLLSCIPLSNVNADSEAICCDSGPVELFLLGPASSGTMSPFDAALADESEEVTISDAIEENGKAETVYKVLQNLAANQRVLKIPGKDPFSSFFQACI